MKKTVRTIAIYIFAAVLAVFCIFFTAASSFLYARADSAPAFDRTDVLEDLEGMTIEGKPFTLSDYAPNDYTKTDVLVLAEYGFSAYSDSRGTFNLYVYVWNPQRISYNLRSELNAIELGVSADGTYTTYEKYALEFLNASDEAGYAGVFYKFKLVLTAAQKENIASAFTGEERFYHVAGIELLQSNASNATDYNVNKEYIYKGYAAGYGADPEAESTLSFRQDVGTTLELDVHSTAYRTEGNNGVNSHTQDSLHSVYFAVPNDVIEEYGELTAVHATWLNAVLAPTLVITQETLDRDYMQAQLDNYLGLDIGEYREDSEYAFLFDGRNVDGFQFAWNYPENGSFYMYYHGVYLPISGLSDEYNQNHETNMTTGAVLDTLNMYLAVDTDDLANYVVSSGTTKARMLELSNTVYTERNKVNGKYARNLFSQVDSDFTEVTIKNDDTFSLTNTTLKDGWDRIWAGLTGGGDKLWNTEYEDLTAIYAVKESDMTGDTEDICKRLYIGEGDFEDFKEYYESHKDGYTVYLFRFQQSNYEAIEGVIYDRNSQNRDSWYEIDGFNSYIFQETVNLDFDIIDVTFTDAQQKETIIAAISNPIDIIPEPTPPIGAEESGVPWLTVAIILAVSLGGIIICQIIRRNVKKTK